MNKLKENWPQITALATIIFIAGMTLNKVNSLDERVARIEDRMIVTVIAGK